MFPDRTLANLRNWDRGFDHHNIVTALVDPTVVDYSGERAYRFYGTPNWISAGHTKCTKQLRVPDYGTGVQAPS